MDNTIFNLTKKLITFKSFANQRLEKKRIVEFVAKQLNSKAVIKKFEHNGISSLVATTTRTKRPMIMLNGHLDVVEADEQQFIPRETARKIYGRGSGDMKGQCAVLIELFNHCMTLPNPPSVGLLLTTDEETGGVNGVQYVLEQHKYHAPYVIIPDGGEHIATVVVGQKGVAHIRVTARGKEAHSARLYQGDNAIDKLFAVYSNIKKQFPDPKNENNWQTTVSLNKIEGGRSNNVVPASASMTLDIRFVSEKELKLILSLLYQAKMNVETLTYGSLHNQKKSDTLVRLYAKNLQKIAGKKPCYMRSASASDARFFASQGSEIILTKALATRIHQDNEAVDKSELIQLYRILQQTILDLVDKKKRH